VELHPQEFEMRKVVIVCAVSVAFGVVVASANAASESLENLQLFIVKVDSSGGITVRMANASQQKLKVWTEANSWGALRWRVVMIRKGQIRTLFEDADGVGFTRNIPVADTIPVGSHIDRHLDVNGKYWSRYEGDKVHFEPGDQLIVIYDVPPESEAKQMHVWYGVTASSTAVK
jgi:hypothetical protein